MKWPFTFKKRAKESSAATSAERAAASRAREYFLDIEGRRRLRHRRIVAFSVVAGILILASGGAWAVFRSAAFTVQEIRVEGAVVIAPDAVRDAVRGALPGVSRTARVLGAQNILSWTSAAAEPARMLLPRARSLSIDPSYASRTVTIRIEERAERGVFCAVGAPEEGSSLSCFWMDDEGILIDRGPIAEGNLIPVIVDRSGFTPVPGEPALALRFIGNLYSIFRVLSEAHVSVEEARIEDRGLEEVVVQTWNGPKLFFSLRFPADHALPVLQSFGTGKTRFPELQYIDFRVEDRAYYK